MYKKQLINEVSPNRANISKKGIKVVAKKHENQYNILYGCENK